MSTTLDIHLLGKDYRVACTADEQASLRAAVAMLETRLAAWRERSRSSDERLAVMVALDLAHELVQSQIAVDGSADGAAHYSALVGENVRRRIDSIEAKIAAALEPNDSLF